MKNFPTQHAKAPTQQAKAPKKPTKKPWLMFTSVYATQYMGVAFILASAVVILRDMGMSLDKLALLNLIALPEFLKIFYAPFIDYKKPIFVKQLQGQYRSWLLSAQVFMVLLLLGIGMFDVTQQFSTVLIVMLIYGLAVSVQDVAIDGLACKVFNESERKFANSVQFSSNLLGNIIGGGLLLMVYAYLGWKGSFIMLALMTGIACIQVAIYKEPEPQKNEANQPTHFKVFWQSLKQFIGNHKTWFGLLLVFPIGFSACFTLINPLLVDAQWSLADIGFAMKVFGSIVGIISALSASLIIKKLGKYKALLYLSFAQALTLLVCIPLSFGNTNKLMVYAAITAYFLVNPALLATIATHIMDRASSQTAKATFFTLQLGLVSFMGFTYAGIAMALAKPLGYSNVMWLGFGLTVMVGCLVARLIAQKRI